MATVISRPGLLAWHVTDLFVSTSAWNFVFRKLVTATDQCKDPIHFTKENWEKRLILLLQSRVQNQACSFAPYILQILLRFKNPYIQGNPLKKLSVTPRGNSDQSLWHVVWKSHTKQCHCLVIKRMQTVYFVTQYTDLSRCSVALKYRTVSRKKAQM